MTVTADWNGFPPETRSWSRRGKDGVLRGCRKVRQDGSVKFDGHRFVPPADVLTRPVANEYLLFFNYGDVHKQMERSVGRDPEVAGEWTAPADPDGYIRRMFWNHACCKGEGDGSRYLDNTRG